MKVIPKHRKFMYRSCRIHCYEGSYRDNKIVGSEDNMVPLIGK